MIVRELHIFDFDATLFQSPMHPDDWEGHIGMWYDTLQSLTPPCVVDSDVMWIDSTVAAAADSVSDPSAYVVLMTGRTAEPRLAARVAELLGSVGLRFDEIHLKPGGGSRTLDWKSQMLHNFIQEFPDLEVVQIWEDRNDHLAGFVRIVEEAGLEAVPHFVSDAAAVPCVLNPGRGAEGYLREYIRGLLTEKEIRGQKKDKRTLYHAGQRPAAPKPKMRWFDREQADEEWMRHWLDSPVRSGVFLSPNPVDIAQFHGVSGNVYAYKVPEWVIEKSGGIHRFDKGSEVLIPEDVWEEAGNEIEFLGKSMEQQELWDKIDMSLYAARGSNPQKPVWMSTKEWKEKRGKWAKGSYVAGLRATKHLAGAIKMMKPEERAEAMVAFEEMYPVALTGKEFEIEWVREPSERSGHPKRYQRAELPIPTRDQEIIDLLQKHLNESVIRSYVRVLLTEAAMGPTDLPPDVAVGFSDPGDGDFNIFYYHTGENMPLSGGTWRGRKLMMPGLPRGKISIEPSVSVGPCSGALMVWSASATHGWGPMLYDVAMELATIHAGGLIADRGSISGEARKVWDYYAANRGDVTGIQLDDLDNTLTPEEEDNCEQNVATYSTGYPSANTTDWTKSPLSKRWTKPPTTMNALKAAGKLVEL